MFYKFWQELVYFEFSNLFWYNFFYYYYYLDHGEVFGWGNSEYGQLLLDNDTYQVNSPKKLQLNESIGKIKDIGTTGSACIALNGKKSWN